MILKTFEQKTGKFNPKEVHIEQKSTNTDTGGVSTNINLFKDIEESINSKVSKSGDILKGTLEFSDKQGIMGVTTENTICDTSKIQYQKGHYNNNVYIPGTFKVVNNIKDISNILDEGSESSFNLTCDDIPTEGSNNLVTSGTLYDILMDLKQRVEALEGQ